MHISTNAKDALGILSTSVAPKLKELLWRKTWEKCCRWNHYKTEEMKIDQGIRSGRVILDTTDDSYNYYMKTLKAQPTNWMSAFSEDTTSWNDRRHTQAKKDS